MLDNLFIVYANNSFRENPENLYKIFDVIHSSFNVTTATALEKLQLKYLAEQLNALAKCNDPNLAKKRRKESLAPYIPEVHFEFSPLFDVAYEAVYRYRNGYCPEKCIEYNGDGLAKIALKLEYGGAQRLKCFECQQLYFRGLLTKLVEGESFEDLIYPERIEENTRREILTDAGLAETKKIIDRTRGGFGFGFGTYVESALDCLKEEIVFADDGRFHKWTEINVGKLVGKSSPYDVNVRFDDFIISLVGHSLTNFLVKNEREKFKKCRKCDKFFIAIKNDYRNIFCPDCSKKSKKSKAEKAEYMKQYRLKKKQDRTAQEREAKIMNYIDNLGCTREDALKIIEADSK